MFQLFYPFIFECFYDCFIIVQCVFSILSIVGGSKTQDLNLRADLVLNMSRGPPGQWFPETEYSERPPSLCEQVAYRPK